MVTGFFADDHAATGLQITAMSFGYKYGIPLDSDLVFDVRFLPNPYYLEHLRTQTGNDEPVRDYVLSFELTGEFIERFFGLIGFLIPLYRKEGKTSLMVAIGCTGGMHRSVTLVNQLGVFLTENDHRVIVYHRDISRAT
jgi:UPF0042 nucleotide-binding protein